MNEVDKLLANFRSEISDRCSVIEQLEVSTDERVVSLFVTALLDKAENDLVRVEILKAMSVRHDDNSNRIILAHAAREVLEREDEHIVRQYAAKALRRFVDLEGVIDTLERIVQNPSDDIDVRHNALAAIEMNVGLPECREALERLVDVPELGQSAQRILRRTR